MVGTGTDRIAGAVVAHRRAGETRPALAGKSWNVYMLDWANHMYCQSDKILNLKYSDWAETSLVRWRLAGASACSACTPGAYTNWTGVGKRVRGGKAESMEWVYCASVAVDGQLLKHRLVMIKSATK